MPDDDAQPAETPDDGRLAVVAHDGEVLPVPGRWDRTVVDRAAAVLLRKYLGDAGHH